jgi:hypothetical protein
MDCPNPTEQALLSVIYMDSVPIYSNRFHNSSIIDLSHIRDYFLSNSENTITRRFVTNIFIACA